MTTRPLGLVVLSMVACGSKSGGAPPDPTTLASLAAAVGACRPLPPPPPPPPPADHRDLERERAVSPADLARCADVAGLMRGDGIAVPGALPPVSPSALPPWDLDGLRDFACAYACAKPGATAYLLAWYVDERGSTRRDHHAALVVAQPAAAGAAPVWTVIVTYRHAKHAWWSLDWSDTSLPRPLHYFDHRPTPAEVYAVLDENRWRFTGDEDWPLLAGNVIDTAWPLATGAPATRFYPPAIER